MSTLSFALELLGLQSARRIVPPHHQLAELPHWLSPEYFNPPTQSTQGSNPGMALSDLIQRSASHDDLVLGEIVAMSLNVDRAIRGRLGQSQTFSEADIARIGINLLSHCGGNRYQAEAATQEDRNVAIIVANAVNYDTEMRLSHGKPDLFGPADILRIGRSLRDHGTPMGLPAEPPITKAVVEPSPVQFRPSFAKMEQAINGEIPD